MTHDTKFYVVLAATAGAIAAWIAGSYVFGARTDALCEEVYTLAFLTEPWPQTDPTAPVDLAALELELRLDLDAMTEEIERYQAQGKLWQLLVERDAAPLHVCSDGRFNLLCEARLEQVKQRMEASCGSSIGH